MTTSTIPRISLGLVLAAAFVLAPVATFAQQADGATFRLLTFASGDSGPRLGATRGGGQRDIVDIHNAIASLSRIDAPEISALPPIPIDMRSLIEAGDVLDLDPADLDEITSTFERVGTLESGKLGPAHAALDGRFDYGVLKCVLAELA